MHFPKWLLLLILGGMISLGVAYDGDKAPPKRTATSAEPRERRHKHKPAPTARPPSTAPDNSAVAATRPVAAAEPEPKPHGSLRATAMALWVVGGILFCALVLLPWGLLARRGLQPHPFDWLEDWWKGREWRFQRPWRRLPPNR